MDEKVLKIVTPIIALLTVVFFATFRFMPAIHERYALVVRGIEGGEESQQVGHVVEGHALYRHLIVLVVTPLHVDAALVLVVRLHPGEHLGIMHGVGIAEHLGQLA